MKALVRFINGLKQAGVPVSICTLGGIIPVDQDIINPLDLESRFFENITEQNFSAFQDLLRHHKLQKMLWLMPPTQVVCEDPRSAQTVGIFRVARAELAIPINTLELDAEEPHFSELVMKVFQKMCSCEDTENIAPDREYAVENGIIKIGRYQLFRSSKGLATRASRILVTLKRFILPSPAF
jgi:hypothetical protein